MLHVILGEKAKQNPVAVTSQKNKNMHGKKNDVCDGARGLFLYYFYNL
jgi:hypothetical protein